MVTHQELSSTSIISRQSPTVPAQEAGANSHLQRGVEGFAGFEGLHSQKGGLLVNGDPGINQISKNR